MKEYGSDFHLVTDYQSERAHLTDIYHDVMLIADGRQALLALICQEKWHRLWIPEYFCYEVIETIRQQTDIEFVFYQDYPFADDREIVAELPFDDGDAILRVNYFGMRDYRSEKDIPVPVVEDHTHDLLGHWALYSDADWCIASLRKTLPLPEGGMFWSPKGHRLPLESTNTIENQRIADARWRAMQMKRDYLNDELLNKDEFRKLYVETEEWFDTANLSSLDDKSKEYIARFDLNLWQAVKKRNWSLLRSMLSDKVETLQPEDDSCTMFSMIVLAETKEQRDLIRKKLIESSVYPAILWQVPKSSNEKVNDFSHRMLSIHCDGRYNEDDIKHLAEIVNQIIEL